MKVFTGLAAILAFVSAVPLGPESFYNDEVAEFKDVSASDDMDYFMVSAVLEPFSCADRVLTFRFKNLIHV